MTDSRRTTRRKALLGTLTAAAVILPRGVRATGFREANDRPVAAAIGTGSRWCQKATGIDGPWGSAPDFRRFADYVAVCDADSARRELAAGLVKEWTGSAPTLHSDYRAILDDPRIENIDQQNKPLVKVLKNINGTRSPIEFETLALCLD